MIKDDVYENSGICHLYIACIMHTNTLSHIQLAVKSCDKYNISG